MSILSALMKKDLKNSKRSLWPAILLGIPLLLLLGLANQVEIDQYTGWRTAYWFCFFFASTALFYRSFGLENESKNFGLYTALKISPWKVLLSQSLVQAGSLLVLAATLLGLVHILWSPTNFPWMQTFELSLLAIVALAPAGSLLGLLLQKEREILFPLFYLPFATPVIAGSHSLSLDRSSAWFYIIWIFILVGGFLSFWIFEFFFDELTELE